MNKIYIPPLILVVSFVVSLFTFNSNTDMPDGLYTVGICVSGAVISLVYCLSAKLPKWLIASAVMIVVMPFFAVQLAGLLFS